MRRRARQGFVLLAVLWVMVGLTALGLALALGARRAIRGARNRREATRAAWVAEDCAARAHAAIDALLTTPVANGTPGAAAWRTLDTALARSPLLAMPPCAITLRAAGGRLDVNSADAEMLHRLLSHALALPSAEIDSLVDALLDWRDPDEVPRPSGAERAWYVEQGRAPPRNGPLADTRELARVKGFERLVGLDTLLDVEPVRVDLNHAPLPVLAALPGFTEDALARVAEQRVRGVPVTNLLAFSATLSPTARAALLARYADLARLATIEPDAWILTSRAHSGEPPVTAVLELRLVRAGARAAVVRRRTWLE